MDIIEKIKERPYTSAVLGLIGLGVVASSIQEVGSAVSGIFIQFGWCVSGNSLCIFSYWAIVIVGMVVFAVLIDFHNKKQAVRQNQIALRREKEKTLREQQKIMTLTKVEPYDNRYDLRIHNNEGSFIVLNEVFVFDRNGTSSRVSVKPAVAVGAGASQTTTFITEDIKSEHPNFFIIGHNNNGISTKTAYPRGVHEFDVRINYDSDERKINNLVKRFRVTVNFKARHDLEIYIEDSDKKIKVHDEKN